MTELGVVEPPLVDVGDELLVTLADVVELSVATVEDDVDGAGAVVAGAVVEVEVGVNVVEVAWAARPSAESVGGEGTPDVVVDSAPEREASPPSAPPRSAASSLSPSA